MEIITFGVVCAGVELMILIHPAVGEVLANKIKKVFNSIEVEGLEKS